MTPLTQSLGLLALLVAVLGGLLLFMIVRALGRRRQRSAAEVPTESTFVAAALQDAVARLKLQEREQHARAEASERLNADIVRNLSSGLIVVRADGAISSVNPAAQRLIGVPGDCGGRPFDEVLGGRGDIAGLIAGGLRSGHPALHRSIDLREAIAPPGTAVRLDVSVSPLFDKDGLFQGVICQLTDLSAEHELQEQLRLKEGLAKLGELAAGIAHEFRNGLATIHGYARLMPMDRLPDVVHPHLQGIQRETAALGDVVTRFLEFAKPAPLLVSSVSVSALVESSVRDVRPLVEMAGGRLDVLMDDAERQLQVDAVLLERALVNVLRNALEACARVPVRPTICLESQWTTDAPGVLLRVLDNGCGFTRESEARAFEPFFTTRGEGTGLGLALAQKFVVLHGGRVTVQNRASSGAEVQIWLPLQPR